MNDSRLERSISDVLGPYGEGDVDVAALRAATMVRVRSARRRRTAVAATGTAMALTAGVLAGPRLLAGGGPTFGTAPSASAAPRSPVTVAVGLPPADAPGAASAPSTVGTDPALLHFDVDVATFGGTGTWWLSGPRFELAEVWTGSSGPGGDYHKAASVRLSVDQATALSNSMAGSQHPAATPPTQVMVGGRPGTLQEFPNAWSTGQSVWALWWMPVDGLWALVEMPADGAGAVIAAASSGLLLDRSLRCAVPVRIAAAPAGARWDSCSTGMEPVDRTGRSWQTGALTFRHDRGGAMMLSYGNYSHDAFDGNAFVPNRTVAGRPAMWLASQAGWQLAVPRDGGRNLFVGVEGEGFGEAEALELAAAAIVSEDLTDPEAWPIRAVG